MKTSGNTSPSEFRSFGIETCILTAINHYKDAQLLCMNNRSNSALSFALIGLEQIGKALLLLDGENPRFLDDSTTSLCRLLIDFPFYENIGENEIPDYVETLLGDLECTFQAKTSELGDEITWIDPICKFREEEFVAELYHSINWFLTNKYQTNILVDAFDSANSVCSSCHNPSQDIITPRETCGRPPRIP